MMQLYEAHEFRLQKWITLNVLCLLKKHIKSKIK